MKKLLTALLVEPGFPCQPVLVEDNIKAMQGVVGGHIESISCKPDPIAILCDEDAKGKALPMNRVLMAPDQSFRDIIHGPFLIVQTKGDKFVSLSDPMLVKYTLKYMIPDRFRKGKNGELHVEHFEHRENFEN